MTAQAIILGQHDADLDSIEKAVRERRRIIASAAVADVRRGDTVRFNDTIRPKYLAGLRATVERVNGKSLAVRVVPEDAPLAQRFGHGAFRCPVTLIEGKVEA